MMGRLFMKGYLLFLAAYITTAFSYSVPIRRQDDGSIDLGDIKKWAAIGDSYSAGIGAGDPIDPDIDPGASKCSRYDQSYPSRLNQDGRLGSPDGRTFTYLSCSGDESPQIIEQAKQLEDDYEFITISAGGNDLGFSDIVQGCIYTIFVQSGCEEVLQKAERILDSEEFSTNINTLLDEAGGHLIDGGKLYYTGYGTFFNAETEECDNVSWTLAAATEPTYLTREFRRRANDLVLGLNDKLRKLVEAKGHVFIDWEPYSHYFLSRFCDPHIDESQTSGIDRFNLMYFQFSFDDTDELELRAVEIAHKRGNEDTTVDNYVPPEGDFDMLKRSWFPDWMLRVFHGTPILEGLVANTILHEMMAVKANQLSIEPPIGVFRPETCDANGPGDGDGDGGASELKCSRNPDGVAVDREPALKHMETFCEEASNHNFAPPDDLNMLGEYLTGLGTYVDEFGIGHIREPKCMGPGASLQIDKGTCMQQLKRTIDDCNTDTITRKRGGRVTYNCKDFQWYPIAKESNLNCYADSKDGINVVSMSRTDGITHIDNVCEDGITVDTENKVDVGTDTPSGPIRTTVSFASDQEGCNPGGKIQLSRDQCKVQLYSILDTCDSDTETEKYGGYMTPYTEGGCYKWDMFASSCFPFC